MISIKKMIKKAMKNKKENLKKFEKIGNLTRKKRMKNIVIVVSIVGVLLIR